MNLITQVEEHSNRERVTLFHGGKHDSGGSFAGVVAMMLWNYYDCKLGFQPHGHAAGHRSFDRLWLLERTRRLGRQLESVPAARFCVGNVEFDMYDFLHRTGLGATAWPGPTSDVSDQISDCTSLCCGQVRQAQIECGLLTEIPGATES